MSTGMEKLDRATSLDVEPNEVRLGLRHSEGPVVVLLFSPDSAEELGLRLQGAAKRARALAASVSGEEKP
jgi:hypothetical protein